MKTAILFSVLLVAIFSVNYTDAAPGLLGEGANDPILDVGSLLNGILGGGEKPKCTTKNYGTVAGLLNEVLSLIGLGCTDKIDPKQPQVQVVGVVHGHN